MKKTTIILLTLSWLAINNLLAQPTQEIQQLLASDGATYDYFGLSSDIDGNFAIVGAYSKDFSSSITNVGAAYVYEYDSISQQWVEVQKLLASDGNDGDIFGYSVAIDGDYIAIGAPGADINSHTDEGAVYIYHYDGNSWSQFTKYYSVWSITSGLGYSVDINSYGGDSINVIAGAPYDDEIATNAGAAYIFHLDIPNNTMDETKLTANGAASGDNFGYSVGISGTKALVGAPFQDGDGTNAGAIYPFYQNGYNWGGGNGFNASETNAGDHFGCSIKIKNDWAIIGSDDNDSLGTNAGAAYIYYYQYYPPVGGFPGFYMWTEEEMLLASDGGINQYFGESVDIDDNGEYAIVGSGIVGGAAYVYKRGNYYYDWSELTKLTASNAALYDRFGISVAISGDNAIIGDSGKDSLAPDAGAAYIFGYTPAPAITQQPDNQYNICLDDTIYFTIEATDVSTYRWQVDEGSGFVDITNNSTYTGADTDSLTISGIISTMDNYMYRCYIENITDTIVSDTVILTTDAILPSITCINDTDIVLNQGDTEYIVQGTEFDPIVSDNCEINSISNNINSDVTLAGEHFNIGNTAVSWIVTDNNGNISNCTFIVQVEEYTGIKTLQSTGITLYPNPTNGLITFNFGNNIVQQLILLDFTGKTVLEKNNLNKIETLNITNLKNGIYMIKILTDTQVYTTKILKK